MKKTLIIFLLLVSVNAVAQHPDLTNRTWYVMELNIGGFDRPLPEFDPEYGYPFLYIYYESGSNGAFSLQSCHAGEAGVTFNGSTSEFEVILPINILLTDCFNDDYQTFENSYFGLYEDNAATPFEYDITDEGGGAYSMVVTSSNGDYVVYGNDLLSTLKLNSSKFSFYPNPVSDILTIDMEEIIIENLTVYSVSGQQLISSSGNTNSLDVSTLSEGIYFLEIVSENGRQVQKFIKK